MCRIHTLIKHSISVDLPPVSEIRMGYTKLNTDNNRDG